MRELKEKITWYDIVSPTEEDIAFIQKHFRIHPVLLAELRQPSARPKVEIHDGYLYMVVHFPFFDKAKRANRSLEIDLLATKDLVATVRYEEFEPMEVFATRCEAIPGFKTHCLGDTSGHFLYRFFESLFEHLTRELHRVNERISKIEEGIFANREKEMIHELSLTKRDILDFRRIIQPLAGILESLADKGKKFYGEGLEIYFADLVGDYGRIWDLAENYKDTIESLETTNQALLSSRIDEVMRILSVIAFLLAPFTIIGTLFQINARFMPVVGRAGDWWIIFALMAGGSAALWVYFRRKKWL